MNQRKVSMGDVLFRDAKAAQRLPVFIMREAVFSHKSRGHDGLGFGKAGCLQAFAVKAVTANGPTGGK